MSDELNLCEKCGDAYTLGSLCRSCAEQEQIDNEYFAGGYDMYEERFIEPQGNWLKCPNCLRTVYFPELSGAEIACPKCEVVIPRAEWIDPPDQEPDWSDDWNPTLEDSDR